jgi:hypothetical protein
MEKIVVLSGNNGDENLVNCLRMLFPECVIEVLEKRPEVKKETFLPRYAECYSVDRMFD